MQDRTKLMKLLVVALVALLATFLRAPASARTGAVVAGNFDAAAAYTSMKCATCHGKKAEKKFDKTKTDGALAEIVLKGKDAKPLKMPAYEAKGVTPEQAAALVAHMRALHP
ncbi:MAG: c-type cytochrome [Pyrinomonadaceae bacterium]